MRAAEPETCDHELKFWWQPSDSCTLLLCACGEYSAPAPKGFKP